MSSPTLYSVLPGDTFEEIARKVYGSEALAQLVREANPGVTEPLVSGTFLTTPPDPETTTPNLYPEIPSLDPNETGILIDGSRYLFWQAVRITRSMDSIDTIEFSCPFEADAPDFRETFVPLSFKSCVFYTGGRPLFTGTLVAINPVLEPKRKTLAVGGYALPGVLNDCPPSPSSYPLEWDDATLATIVDKLIRPFGIGAFFKNDLGPIFERVACEPSKKILAFLIELAQERGLVVSSGSDGSLVFQKSVDAGQPVATLRQGESPLVAMTPTFTPQEYYSHITGIEPVIMGLPGSQYTVRNDRLTGVLRPFTFEAADTKDADVQQLVEAKAGRMFANVASYSLELSTWRDPDGALWEPNTTIIVQAPGAMVYEPFEFLIRSVTFERDSKSETATLTLTFPESFKGQLPERMPWES